MQQTHKTKQKYEGKVPCRDSRDGTIDISLHIYVQGTSSRVVEYLLESGGLLSAKDFLVLKTV